MDNRKSSIYARSGQMKNSGWTQARETVEYTPKDTPKAVTEKAVTEEITLVEAPNVTKGSVIPIIPVQPEQPAKTVQPVKPIQPAKQPIQPAKQPIQPTKIAQPVQPIQSAKPVQPAKSVQPVQPEKGMPAPIRTETAVPAPGKKAAASREECGFCVTIGMAYVPTQQWRDLYEPTVGFDRGTIFSELDLPFIGREAVSHE